MLYRDMVESAHEFAMFSMDMAGTIMTWNTGAEKLFGFSRSEAIGKDTSLIFVEEDREAQVPEQEIRGALEAGRAKDERWHLRKDGSRFWADGVLLPLRDSLGKTEGFVKIIQDGSDKHDLRQHVRELEQKAGNLHAE
jgi:PAS domain S-box-containing protein